MSESNPHRNPFLVDDPQRDPQETAFLTSIMENPDDDAPRLIFADWLDENAMTDKAAFVRQEVAMSRLAQKSEEYEQVRNELYRLDGSIGGDWSAALCRPGRLLNCGSKKSSYPTFRFAFECPNRWADLTPTADSKVRFCGQCRKNVHRCESREEAEQHAVAGRCIAISSRVALTVLDQFPVPKPPEPIAEMEEMDITGLPMQLQTRPPSPYELWADEFFSRHPKPPWWQFWR
jgi:uncharacterized protein (TIGR02996 family)